MKKKAVVILILILVASSIFNVYASTIDSQILKNQQELERVKNLLQSIDENKERNEKEQRTIEVEINDLEASIRALEAEVANLSENISQTAQMIMVKSEEIEVAEGKIADKKDIMDKRLRVMYKSGTVGYLEVLLGAEDFEDLLSRIDNLKLIFDHDKTLLKDYVKQKKIVVDAKIELEAHKVQLEDLKSTKELAQAKLRVEIEMLAKKMKELEEDHIALSNKLGELEEDADKITDIIANLELRKKYVGGKMIWPVDSTDPNAYRITSPFGNRRHPILNTVKLHTGIDIGAKTNSSIISAQEGTVIYAGWLGGYGKAVMIDHGGGIVTLYAHNSRLTVKLGQIVTKGQEIAKSGSTGISTGPHLHFEVREDGKYVNPEDYVTGN